MVLHDVNVWFSQVFSSVPVACEEEVTLLLRCFFPFMTVNCTSVLLLPLLRDDPFSHALSSGQPLLHVHRFCSQQHRTCSASSHHPGLRVGNLLHPLRYKAQSLTLISSRVSPVTSSGSRVPSGLALVVGLVLYISSINDEMLNRTKSSEAYFTYKYGWSFAFAAFSFLLTEVKKKKISSWQKITFVVCRHTHNHQIL